MQSPLRASQVATVQDETGKCHKLKVAIMMIKDMIKLAQHKQSYINEKHLIFCQTSNPESQRTGPAEYILEHRTKENNF